jgi:hypothetical protein
VAVDPPIRGSIGAAVRRTRVWHAQCFGEARKAGYLMADIDVDIDTNFPDRSVEDAIETINAERSRKRLIALSGIALALLIAALSTYLAYA